MGAEWIHVITFYPPFLALLSGSFVLDYIFWCKTRENKHQSFRKGNKVMWKEICPG
jgi:hypothetical protein